MSVFCSWLVMANVGGNQEKVYDVDMLNRDLLESHQYTVKALQEANASLKAERGQLLNERADFVRKSLRMRDKRDQLIEERDKLKNERKLLTAARNELKTEVAHFKKDGENGRHKIRHLKLILEE